VAPRTSGLHYRGWLIHCTRERIAGGWCALVEVWRPGRDPATGGEVVPFTSIFDEGDDAYVEGLEAGKRWIDARQ
jgi:hypothetical protein